MALATLSDLKTEMANRSARTDLTTYLDNMIILGEARILRDLKRSPEMWVTTTLTVDAQTVALPADFAGMIRIKLGTEYPPLKYMGLDQFHSTTASDDTGRPRYYTIEANNLLVAPGPDGSYTANYTYVQKLDLVTDSTNRLLTIYPDIYLWASMVELADFIQDDEKMAKYLGRYNLAIESMLESAQAVASTLEYMDEVP